jgi:hypothetical protein
MMGKMGGTQLSKPLSIKLAHEVLRRELSDVTHARQTFD